MKGFYMGEERDETGPVRATCWRLCDVKDSYSYATAVAALLNGGEKATTATTGKASEWLMRASPTSSLTRTDIWSKIVGGYSEKMQHYLGRGLI